MGVRFMSRAPEQFRALEPQEVASAIRMTSESTQRKVAREGKIPFHLDPEDAVWLTLDDIDEIPRPSRPPARTNGTFGQLVDASQDIPAFRTRSRSTSTHRIRANG